MDNQGAGGVRRVAGSVSHSWRRLATPVGDAATVFLAGVLADPYAGPLCFAHVLAGDAAVHPDAPGAAGLRAPAHQGRAPGALPFYDEGESYVTDEVVFDEPELAPPPPPQELAAVDELGIAEPAMAPPLPIPPPPLVPADRNATAAGLRRFIPTGHVPAGATSRGLEGRPPRSGEGEA